MGIQLLRSVREAALRVPAVSRPPRIHPGSLEDRILEAVPPAPVPMETLIEAGKARAEDVKACVKDLRAAGLIRMIGDKRGARYVRTE